MPVSYPNNISITNRIVQMKVFCFCCLGMMFSFSQLAHAKPYIPTDMSQVLATHNPSSLFSDVTFNFRRNSAQETVSISSHQILGSPLADEKSVADQARIYLDKADQPGYNYLYGRAQKSLLPFISNNTNNVKIWLLWATIEQHEHRFSEAIVALKRVTKKQPLNINANLMLARIYLIQNNIELAQEHCSYLFGESDFLTALACNLEVSSHVDANALERSYQLLSVMVNRTGLPSDARGSWLSQMLAEMAYKQNNILDAERWLAAHFDGSPSRDFGVSFLSDWADLQLELKRPQLVLDFLGTVVTNAPSIDDALLLRLALAERQQNSLNAHIQRPRDHWGPLFKQRVALRERRQDIHHASELTRYYLDLEPSAIKAVLWAKINWDQSKEYKDKVLLDRAVAMKGDIDA